MKIAIADFCGMRFDACTVDNAPLGGTQSAACYLSRALARQGQDVFLLANVPAEGVRDGVACVAMRNALNLSWQTLDALVCIGPPADARAIRRMLSPNARLVSWISHAPDQPAVQFLRNAVDREPYDGFAMVSQWQFEKFQREFGIEPSRMGVMRNAPGFAFEKQFGAEAILPHKLRPPVLAYTSTPFRGLDVLLEVFPRIRAAVPGTRLQVFSSAAVYQTDPAKDEATFGRLYSRCKSTDGVEYIGSLPQPELARALRAVSVLAYPNTFAETSCISVMEALASGCRVVTTELAALPETSAGFARLIRRWPTLEQYLADFLEQTAQVLREAVERPSRVEEQLRRQVDYVNETGTWAVRAREWVRWLESMPARSAGQA